MEYITENIKQKLIETILRIDRELNILANHLPDEQPQLFSEIFNVTEICERINEEVKLNMDICIDTLEEFLFKKLRIKMILDTTADEILRYVLNVSRKTT